MAALSSMAAGLGSFIRTPSRSESERKLEAQECHRWELNPASAEDYEARQSDKSEGD